MAGSRLVNLTEDLLGRNVRQSVTDTLTDLTPQGVGVTDVGSWIQPQAASATDMPPDIQPQATEQGKQFEPPKSVANERFGDIQPDASPPAQQFEPPKSAAHDRFDDIQPTAPQEFDAAWMNQVMKPSAGQSGSSLADPHNIVRSQQETYDQQMATEQAMEDNVKQQRNQNVFNDDISHRMGRLLHQQLVDSGHDFRNIDHLLSSLEMHRNTITDTNI